MKRSLALAFALTALLAACGSHAFEPQFAERQDPAMAAVMRDLAAAPARPPKPVIVAVVRSPAGLLLWDLAEGRQRWRVSVEVRSTPIVAGDYVVTTEPDGVAVRNISDGSLALVLDDPELHLIGADGEGRNAVIALARGESATPLGFVVGVRDGSSAWSHELPLPVGVPAVAGRVAVVPWGQQRLSMLDMTDGAERLRLRMEHGVVGYALRHGEKVYVGQHKLFALTQQLFDDGRLQRAGLEPRGRVLPGQPPLLPDAYVPRMDADNARNRVHLDWSLSAAGSQPATFADDALYFVFYRLVFGLTAGEDDVRWVQDREHDVVGSGAVAGGIVVVSDDGSVAMLSAADGHALFQASLGTEVRAAAVSAAGFQPPAATTPAVAVPPLPEQLRTAASLQDVRVGGGRALAIRFLARDDSAEVTERLVAFCADRSDASQARTSACEQLAGRENGQPAVLAALHEGASFLDSRAAPPVGALARAAATMHARPAVPFLIRHLEDPATPADELPQLFEGLARIGDARALAPIERFLRLYHADATDGLMIAALGSAAEALVALSRDRAEIVQTLADDPLAPQPVQQRLAAALARPSTPAPTAPAEPTPPPPARPAREPAVEPELPVSVTSEMSERVLAPVAARLHRCLDRPGAADPFPSARVVLMLNDEGAIQRVSVTPAELQACVEPLVRTRTFPRTRRGSEIVIHTVRR